MLLMHFDEGTGLPEDSSRFAHACQKSLAAWTADGKFGSGLRFDGVDDEVALPPCESLSFSGRITCEAWIRSSGPGGDGYQTVLTKAGEYMLLLAADGRSISVHNWDLAPQAIYAACDFFDNMWRHVAFTYDGKERKIYVDGELIASDAPAGVITPNAQGWLQIGKYYGGTEFRGAIDEVRISKAIRTFRPFKAAAGVETAARILFELPRQSGQWLEGFAEASGGTKMTYRCHREPKARALYVCAKHGADAIEWVTAGVPKAWEGESATFLWTTGLGCNRGNRQFELSVNGVRRFAFNTLRDWHWTVPGEQGSSLSFIAVEEDEWGDLFGYMKMTAPTAWVKPGGPAKLEITGGAFKSDAWVMVFECPDTLSHFQKHQSTRQVYCDLSRGDLGAVAVKLVGRPEGDGKQASIHGARQDLGRATFNRKDDLAIAHFSFPGCKGHPQDALTEPLSIVIDGKLVQSLGRLLPPNLPPGMRLITDGDRTYRYITPVQFPGNDREFIIDHLFTMYDPPNLKHWRMAPGKGCVGEHWEIGFGPIAVWDSEGPGSALTLRGEIEADLDGYAYLRVRAMASRSVGVSMGAVVDGKLVKITAPQPGVDEYGEYTGAIRGKRLSAVEVCFEASGPGRLANAVMWVMLVKEGEPTPIEKPDPAWPGLLVEEAPADPKPGLGLVFDAHGLEWLRNELRSPALSRLWAQRVREAEGYLVDKAPEEFVNPVISTFTTGFGRPNAPYAHAGIAGRVRTLGYVGIVEKRADMLRLAARWALTWTRCERWAEYGIENLKGIPFSSGRFTQSYTASLSSLVLDWCGSVLTPEGRRALAEAIHDKGVLDLDTHPPPWTSNQGLVYENGRFTGALAVRHWYPEEFEQRAKDALGTLQLALSWCIKPDGVGVEGPSYWEYALAQAPMLYGLIAKTCGRPAVRKTVPEVTASARWAYVNLRTDADARRLSLLTYSDGGGFGRYIPPNLAAFFAGPLGMEEYQRFARETYPASVDPSYLMAMREVPAGATPAPPTRTLTVFPEGGQVDIRQKDPRAGMRIYFLSGEWGFHTHAHKNSLILEAFGQTLLLDRGTPSYSHAEMKTICSSQAHNTVVPDDVSQTIQVGKPAAQLLRAEEKGAFVVVESDAANAWPALGRRVLRRAFHLRPDTLVVEDVLSWKRPVVTHQYWQSHGEWRESKDGWATGVNGVELCLTVLPTQDLTISAEPFSVDGDLRTVHRLNIQTRESPEARIVTVLRVRRSASEEWPGEARYDSETDSLHLRRKGGGAFGVFWKKAEYELRE